MVVVGQFSMLESSANRLDTEQEREQEQEQEKEIEARRDQQIEIEKFVDREYSRQEEFQRPWPFTVLAKPLNETVDHPFYALKDFKLRHQDSLEFPSSLWISNNFFNQSWGGLRRIKNVIMVRTLTHVIMSGQIECIENKIYHYMQVNIVCNLP